MNVSSRMSKERILKTIEDFYNEINTSLPGGTARQYAIHELIMRLNPKPKSSYVKKGASKILKNEITWDKRESTG